MKRTQKSKAKKYSICRKGEHEKPLDEHENCWEYDHYGECYKAKKKVVKARLSSNKGDRERGYAYVHFDKEKPIVDSDYTLTPCTITYTLPLSEAKPSNEVRTPKRRKK